MSKIKNLVAKLSDEMKELGKKFPLTMGLIIFVTILYTIAIDQDFSKSTEDWLEKIYLFCTIWGVGTFFTETIFVKKQKKVISYGVTGGISLVFTQILTSSMLKSTGEETTYRFLGAYLIVLILITIYQSIQNAELKFEEYFLKLFRDLFNVTATYIILNIGLMLVTTIFVELILDGKYGSILERIFALLGGLFYVPAMLYSFSGISKKEVNNFIKGLVLYVLLPLTTIAIAIIYIYIAKIILLQDMPQNTIYRILAGIFIVAFPVWNMAKNYAEEKKLIGKITKILPYAYAPFILLEIYSIGTRIREFGITPMRYVSCLFIVFQAMALALTFYKNQEKITKLCIGASILVVILFVSPWHYENVSNWSQKGIIEKKMPENTDFGELQEEDKAKVKSAYEYLKYEANEEKAMPAYLSDENKAKIEEYKKAQTRNYQDKEYISLNCELELEIREYSKITYEASDNKEDGMIVLKSGKKLDLSEKIKEIIRKNEIDDVDLEEDFQSNPILKISQTQDFYIQRISFRYDTNTQEYDYVYAEGYLLER